MVAGGYTTVIALPANQECFGDSAGSGNRRAVELQSPSRGGVQRQWGAAVATAAIVALLCAAALTRASGPEHLMVGWARATAQTRAHSSAAVSLSEVPTPALQAAGARGIERSGRLLQQCGETLDFDQSYVVHNNLDGRGPAPGEPTMTVRNVIPTRLDAVNLEITATSPYQPANATRNGVTNSSLGRISVAAGTSVDLLFRLVEDATWRPAQLQGPLCFSVFSLEDQLTAGGFASYALFDGSLLQAANDSIGLLYISGPRWPRGTVGDSPQGHRNFSSDSPGSSGVLRRSESIIARSLAVIFLFHGSPEFQFSYSVAAGAAGGGSDLVFGGPLLFDSNPAQVEAS